MGGPESALAQVLVKASSVKLSESGYVVAADGLATQKAVPSHAIPLGLAGAGVSVFRTKTGVAPETSIS